MNRTKIEWTDFTANPIRYRDAYQRSVWACIKASEGCQHCYAESLARRYQAREFTAKAMEGVTPFVDEKELKAMLSPTRLPAGSKCFVGDMTDVFGEWVPFEYLDRLFAVFALRSDVVFQVLTKRPERMREYLGREQEAVANGWMAALDEMATSGRLLVEYYIPADFVNPLPNVWLGTSVELQRWADVRIPELLATPAAVRFLSCEPLLGEVDLRYTCGCDFDSRHILMHGIDWVIVGGESGPGARPCDVGWIRSIVAQCQAAGTKVFVKQLGAMPWTEWEAGESRRLFLKSRKGGDMAEWAEDLRVREWPLETRVAE